MQAGVTGVGIVQNFQPPPGLSTQTDDQLLLAIPIHITPCRTGFAVGGVITVPTDFGPCLIIEGLGIYDLHEPPSLLT